MPREQINDTVQSGWYAEVSWRRKPGLDPDDQGTNEGHVQLGSVNLQSPFHFPDVEHGTSWEAGAHFDGWRVTLDEAGVARLIKALHKAKRQAFGEPEGGVLPSGTTRFVEDRPEAEALFSGQGPRPVRIIGDQPEAFPFIPTDGSERSRRSIEAASRVAWPASQPAPPAVLSVEGYQPDADSGE